MNASRKHAETAKVSPFTPESNGELFLKHLAMDSIAEGITIADARRPEMPIIYANEAFYRITGYSTAEVINRNCRFLQGPDTNLDTIEEMRAAIREGWEITVEILNYRKDGSKFWNRVSITPIRDSNDTLTHFVGVQTDISRRVAAEEKLKAANARLQALNERINQELEAAARAQLAHLPSSVIEVPGLKTASAFRPCNELAGDNFNLVSLDERHLAVYILDVVGHGACAALESVTLSRILTPIQGEPSILFEEPGRNHHSSFVPPARVLQNLNRRYFAEESRGQFYTILYGILDLETGEFCYSSAGHPPPLLVRGRGNSELLDSAGFVIGHFEGAEYDQHRVHLHPGDRLYLFTDGALEAGLPDRQEFGKHRIVDVLEDVRDEELGASIDILINELTQWCHPGGFFDDVSIVALEKVG